MTKFYQGKPCKHGHTTKYEKTNSCVECCRIRDSKKVERDYWSLTFKKVIVPQVTMIFWEAMRVSENGIFKY